jgi:hypothetical protein
MKWRDVRIAAAGAAVILLTNAIALGGAAYNRSAAPESTLRLTERELRPVGSSRDNSGVELEIRWRTDWTAERGIYPYWGGYAPSWLDAKKMASLGFDTQPRGASSPDSGILARQLSKEVVLVLELDGPASRNSAEQARAMAQKLRNRGGESNLKEANDIENTESATASRLFVVDAGLDASLLRAKYPDRSMYALALGRITPSENGGQVRGSVTGLLVQDVNVPVEHRSVFEGAVSQNRWESAPSIKFEAVVDFGQRLEPWLVSATRK